MEGSLRLRLFASGFSLLHSAQLATIFSIVELSIVNYDSLFSSTNKPSVVVVLLPLDRGQNDFQTAIQSVKTRVNNTNSTAGKSLFSSPAFLSPTQRESKLSGEILGENLSMLLEDVGERSVGVFCTETTKFRASRDIASLSGRIARRCCDRPAFSRQASTALSGVCGHCGNIDHLCVQFFAQQYLHV